MAEIEIKEGDICLVHDAIEVKFFGDYSFSAVSSGTERRVLTLTLRPGTEIRVTRTGRLDLLNYEEPEEKQDE